MYCLSFQPSIAASVFALATSLGSSCLSKVLIDCPDILGVLPLTAFSPPIAKKGKANAASLAISPALNSFLILCSVNFPAPPAKPTTAARLRSSPF